jgi:hypothetical protein
MVHFLQRNQPIANIFSDPPLKVWSHPPRAGVAQACASLQGREMVDHRGLPRGFEFAVTTQASAVEAGLARGERLLGDIHLLTARGVLAA